MSETISHNPGKFVLKLNAHESRWLNGLTKDPQGQTRYAIADDGRQKAIAGGPDNTVFLSDACRKVARAALIGAEDAQVSVKPIVEWLEDGVRLEVILFAIKRQIDQLGVRYLGCRSFHYFHRAVMDAHARDKRFADR